MHHQQLQQAVCQTVVPPPQLPDPMLVTPLAQSRKRLPISRRQSNIELRLVARLINHTKDEHRQQT